MDKLEENAIKIANYLEDKLSPEEEEAFMKELAENEALREQYEGELLVKTLLQSDVWEEATKYGQDRDGEDNRARVVSFFSRYKMAVAASMILVAGVLVFYLAHNGNGRGPEGPGKGTVARTQSGAGKDTGKANDQPPATEQLSHNGNTAADSLFVKYFTRYTGGNDPALVKSYFDAYRQENYATVLAVSDSAVWAPGDSSMNELARQYIRLYKGLSYLDQGLTDEALGAFEPILDAAAAGHSSLYYEAQWYTGLTWLKKTDTGKARALAGDISKSSSPYNTKAAQLLTELK